MVIIPTEKRFDWNYAPVILFAIVLINILIFFFYQSGDNEKYEKAFYSYQTNDFLKIEWPFFKKYLSEKGEQKSLKEFEHLFDENMHGDLSFQIILRLDFYDYLLSQKELQTYLTSNDIGDWHITREQIHKDIQSTSTSAFGLTPSDTKILNLLSHQFLHGDIMHLLGNMFFLIICGFAVEAAIGRWRFLAFYLVSGVAGGLLHIAFNLKEVAPLVGASGAISGIMAMYLGLFRLKKIEFFYWFFIFVGYFKAPALFILFFYIGKEVVQFLSDSGSNVAFMAHAGGFVSGSLLIAACYFFIPKVFNKTYIEEDQSIDPIQEKLSTIYEFIAKYQFDAAEKALARAIAETGKSFDFSVLQYNLAKIKNNNSHVQYALDIFNNKRPTRQEVKKIEHVWTENPDLHEQLNQDQIIKVGMHLLSLPNPEPAAKICDRLVEKQCSDLSLGILAQKLSIAFGEANNSKRKQNYESISKDILARDM